MTNEEREALETASDWLESQCLFVKLTVVLFLFVYSTGVVVFNKLKTMFSPRHTR